MNKKKINRGQVLVIVIAVMLFLMIIIPALIYWTQNQAKWSVKQQNKSIAFNLAEAGIDRGLWKVKSSTSIWNMASKGQVITGYNFDITYSDIPGGIYRIKFSSGPAGSEVTVTAEGKDSGSKEIRAIKVIFKNQTIPGAIISKGIITWANAFEAHWGPIMSHGNINITDAVAAKKYYPRKFSRQVVSSLPSYPRDINGLTPPNTDNVEWWSDYPVPDLPQLDFATLKSSAQATNTLNIYGCSKMSINPNPSGHPWGWWGSNKCNLGGAAGSHNGLKHFQNAWNHPWARKGYTWFWDQGDLIFTGGTAAKGCGIWGNVIVRGNLTNYQGDNYYFTGKVPSEAWREYTKITETTGDTAATNQYPADNGYQKNRATFNFGSETWTGGPASYNTDVGLRGFLYVGGNYDIKRDMDIYGAVWVEGSVSKATGAAERTIIFFDDSLSLPAFNVVLVRLWWGEIMPSSQAWP